MNWLTKAIKFGEKIKKVFPKEYMPYKIGYVSRNKQKLNLYNKIRW